MTPGPTQVAENVRMARSLATTNPDLDVDFYDFYKETCEKLSAYMHTNHPFYIMSGEGILGLEAACASLTEPGDRVLVIDNGIFGAGFADFVTMYGGTPVVYSADRLEGIDIEKLERFLEKDNDFKYATIVHCDTPSGVLNDIHNICPMLKRHGVLTVVDAVASMFGEDIYMDRGQIDVLCGATQKALSAPVGLTMVGVSDDAITVMESRKTPIASFYCNLLNFKNYYEEKWFPYSMPISDINGLAVALDNVIKDTHIVERHHNVANATRKVLTSAGLKLHLNAGYSSTVTVFNVPEGVESEEVLRKMSQEHGVMIAGCFAELAGKVLRIGHMGENARAESVRKTLEALDKSFRSSGFIPKANMAQEFMKHIDENTTTFSLSLDGLVSKHYVE